MIKRILVIPDVHGRIFWKEPVQKYIDQVNKVVFLGDYLDPYEDEDGIAEDIFENLLEIIELKRSHPRNVVLLKGNHDEHYSSTTFMDMAAGSRMDRLNWNKYHKCFDIYHKLFNIAHLAEINGQPYLFTHAGVTTYWLNKVNARVWHLPDNEVSLADPKIVRRLNALDNNERGEELLSVIGKYRSFFHGEKTGSVLWADVNEHPVCDAPKAYGLDKVFQVFGHTNIDFNMIQFENFAMIDSQQCFMIDSAMSQRIMTISKYEDEMREHVRNDCGS